jgi:hypothetical protein
MGINKDASIEVWQVVNERGYVYLTNVTLPAARRSLRILHKIYPKERTIYIRKINN